MDCFILCKKSGGIVSAMLLLCLMLCALGPVPTITLKPPAEVAPSATPTVSQNDSLPAPEPLPDYTARIPDLKIPDNIHSRDEGASHFFGSPLEREG